MSKYLYIIDNGHGEETKKKESLFYINGEKFYEYYFNRQVSKFISLELKSKAIEHVLLVPELNDIGLKERVKRANNMQLGRKCILISIHADQCNEVPKARGLSVFYNKKLEKSLAEIFQKNLIQSLGLKDRGIKQANFSIIKNTIMPSILSENGFYSNFDEAVLLSNIDFQYKCAMAHVNAILETENNFGY